MDCAQVKAIFSSYLNNAASPADVAEVEAHLCVCQACRDSLGKFMDSPIPAPVPAAAVPAPVAEKRPAEKTSTPKARMKSVGSDEPLTVMEYVVVVAAIAILGFLLFLLAKK